MRLMKIRVWLLPEVEGGKATTERISKYGYEDVVRSTNSRFSGTAAVDSR
jgi:hypothetical protein